MALTRTQTREAGREAAKRLFPPGGRVTAVLNLDDLDDAIDVISRWADANLAERQALVSLQVRSKLSEEQLDAVFAEAFLRRSRGS